MLIGARRGRSILIPIALMFVAALFLVSPRGEFPLNDDWVYAEMVRSLLATGRPEVHPYASAWAIPQTVLGAGLSKVFGFGFTTLRATTLVMAFLAAWAASLCAREIGASRGQAIAAAALLLMNPLFLNLSYSFMTDVPFVTFTLFSVLFYLKSLRRPGAIPIGLGSVFAALAFANRQYGVLLPAAFIMAAGLFAPRTHSHWSTRNAAALLLPFVAGVVVVILIARASSRPLWTGLLTDSESARNVLRTAADVLFCGLQYIGIFLSPIAVVRLLAAGGQTERRSRTHWGIVAATSVSAIVYSMWVAGPLPNLPNIMRDLGVGPLLLSDADPAGSPSPVSVGGAVWWPVTIWSAVSAGVLVAHTTTLLRATGSIRASIWRARRSQFGFLVVCAVALTLAPCNPFQDAYFDRYLLPALPLAAVLAFRPAPRAKRAVSGRSPGLEQGRGARSRHRLQKVRVSAGILLASMLFSFSVISLQDYMAWNRARWTALDILRDQRGVPDLEIDGGYEFNGYYTSEEYIRLVAESDSNEHLTRPIWVVKDTWKVAFRPQPGYTVVETVPYYSWLGFMSRDILILKRDAVADDAADTG